MVEVELPASLAHASPTGLQSACQFPKCSIALWNWAALPFVSFGFADGSPKLSQNFFSHGVGASRRGYPQILRRLMYRYHPRPVSD